MSPSSTMEKRGDIVGYDLTKSNSKLIRVDISKSSCGKILRPLKPKRECSKVLPSFTKSLYFSFNTRFNSPWRIPKDENLKFIKPELINRGTQTNHCTRDIITPPAYDEPLDLRTRIRVDTPSVKINYPWKEGYFRNRYLGKKLKEVNDEPRTCGKRTNYTEDQLKKLESYFLQDQYPSKKIQKHLARVLRVHVENVKIWFQNKRARNKKKTGKWVKLAQYES